MTTLEVSLSMAERGDHTAAQALVDDIGRRGRVAQLRYVDALTETVIHPSSLYTPWSKADVWWLLTATPAQIAAAYREATRT